MTKRALNVIVSHIGCDMHALNIFVQLNARDLFDGLEGWRV